MTASGGLLVVLAGPSGAGRGTVITRLRRALPDAVTAVQMTTREPRPEERDGVEYRFVDRDDVERSIHDDALLEWAEYGGTFYGTPRAPVVASVAAGNVVLVDVEVAAARQVAATLGGSSLVVQLVASATASPGDAFDVTIVNDDVDGTVGELVEAITAARAAA